MQSEGGDEGVPMFLDQLVQALRLGLSSSSEIGTSAVQHGQDLLRQGFSVSQVVHGYGDVCEAITKLALERDAAIATDDFRMLNRCPDDAIASAVTESGRARNQFGIDGEATRGSERFGFLAHELRNLTNTAIVGSSPSRCSRPGTSASLGAPAPCCIGTSWACAI